MSLNISFQPKGGILEWDACVRGRSTPRSLVHSLSCRARLVKRPALQKNNSSLRSLMVAASLSCELIIILFFALEARCEMDDLWCFPFAV